MIVLAYLVLLVSLALGCVWCDENNHDVWADALGVVCIALIVLGFLII